MLAEAYRVLRPGGEFYFADVYSDRRVPAEAQQNEVTVMMPFVRKIRLRATSLRNLSGKTRPAAGMRAHYQTG